MGCTALKILSERERERERESDHTGREMQQLLSTDFTREAFFQVNEKSGRRHFYLHAYSVFFYEYIVLTY